eukprot:scaffold4556_cov114-Isochrysis_galbana.AAC.8
MLVPHRLALDGLHANAPRRRRWSRPTRPALRRARQEDAGSLTNPLHTTPTATHTTMSPR